MDIKEEVRKILNEEINTPVNFRKKVNLISYEHEAFDTSSKIYFKKRGIHSINYEKLIDLLFDDAEKKQRLKFETQTISFDEEDAKDLDLEKDKEYHMLEFFELLLCILS